MCVKVTEAKKKRWIMVDRKSLNKKATSAAGCLMLPYKHTHTVFFYAPLENNCFLLLMVKKNCFSLFLAVFLLFFGWMIIFVGVMFKSNRNYNSNVRQQTATTKVEPPSTPQQHRNADFHNIVPDSITIKCLSIVKLSFLSQKYKNVGVSLLHNH